MNELQWRRQLRDLRQPVPPERDLWASIEAAMDQAELAGTRNATSGPARSNDRRRWLIAASFAASVVLAGAMGWLSLIHI